MDDRYLVIARSAVSELKIKGSRFIGEAHEIPDPVSAMALIESIRKREYSASHHCYAWRVGIPHETAFKHSDDGEPKGTAGRPIYDVIRGRQVTNCLIVVTRYFGGTKLGTGGLAHAYADSAAAVLEMAGHRECYLTCRFSTRLEFSLYDQWQLVLQQMEAAVISSEYTDAVCQIIEIRLSRAEPLRSRFIELTAGRGLIEDLTADANNT